MHKSKVPSDSILHEWIRSKAVTEVPMSYIIAAGITTIGVLLKRNIYIDQQEFCVYPNQSVLFIGPSGIGKDTIINAATKFISQLAPGMVIGGRTTPTVYKRLQNLGNPACGYIPAGELTAFFGQSDYQNSMLMEFTDLLSTLDKKDISTKSDMALNGEWKPIYIYQPTLTMHCGSTEEWLHKATPEGTLEGGFLGRFLIVPEQFGGRHVALIKHEISFDDRKLVRNANDKFREGVEEIVRRIHKPQEMHIMEDARFLYQNWYANRFRLFSRAVLPYANRSRDMVLRLAMLMAVSRGHYNFVEEEDIQFGIDFIAGIAQRIDKVILPPTPEAQAGEQILSLLPATSQEVWKILGRKYPLVKLNAAFELLQRQGRIRKESKEGPWHASHPPSAKTAN